MPSPTSEGDRVIVSLSRDEAIVLHDWLARFHAGRPSFEDQAEQRVLWDLEATLESALAEPLRSDFPARLAEARSRVRDQEG